MRIHERMKARRAALGLTHQQAAAELGLPLRTYQEWEGEGVPLSVERAVTLFRWLGPESDTNTNTDEENARG